MYHFFTKLLNMSLTAGILVPAVMVMQLLYPISISRSLSAFNFLHTRTNEAGQAAYLRYIGKYEKPKLRKQRSSSFP